MAGCRPSRVKTFSIGFEDQEFDELPHARLVAERFGDRPPRVRRPAPMRSRSCRSSSATTASRSPTPRRSRRFYLAELTRRHVTVALNGDGGDESFAGYVRYVANRLAGRLDGVPGPLRAGRRRGGGPAAGGAADVGACTTRRGASRERWRSIAAGSLRELHVAGSTALSASSSTRPSSRADAGLAGERRDRRIVGEHLGRERRRQAAGGRRQHLPGRRPAREDRHRDHGLLARGALAIPRPRADGVRRVDSRRRSRSAAPRRSGSCAKRLRGWLPDEILDRPKQGFGVPLSGWLRGDLRAWSRELLLDRETLDRGYFRRDAIAGLLDRHAAGRDDDDKRIWALLMLELWHREFIDAGVGQRPALAVAA